MHTARVVRAPRGTELTCKNWLSEAAYRMIQNNLDPEVAEKPEDLVVYGGRGKAARNWESFDAILDSLINLEEDETLLVQSGKPVVEGFGLPGGNYHSSDEEFVLIDRIPRRPLLAAEMIRALTRPLVAREIPYVQNR